MRYEEKQNKKITWEDTYIDLDDISCLFSDALQQAHVYYFTNRAYFRGLIAAATIQLMGQHGFPMNQYRRVYRFIHKYFVWCNKGQVLKLKRMGISSSAMEEAEAETTTAPAASNHYFSPWGYMPYKK